MMQEIQAVHKGYEHDLAEAQDQAKAKAMATLKQEKSLGENLNINGAFKAAEKAAPKMKKIHVPKAVKFAREKPKPPTKAEAKADKIEAEADKALKAHKTHEKKYV